MKNICIVTNELVEFEIDPVEIQDVVKMTNYIRGIYGIYPKKI